MNKKDFIEKFISLYKKTNYITKEEEKEIRKMLEEKVKNIDWIRD